MGWASAAMQGVGTSFNIYQGLRSNRQASDAQKRRDQQLAAAEAEIADQKNYFKQNVEPIRMKILNEASKEGLTTGAQRAQDDISKSITEQRRRLSMRPGGLTADQDLALSLEGTKALARSTQDDNANKFSMRSQAYQLGAKMPDYVSARVNLLGGMAGISAQDAQMHRQNSNAAYQGAASGLAGIADELARMAVAPVPSGPTVKTSTMPDLPGAQPIQPAPEMKVEQVPTSIEDVRGNGIQDSTGMIPGSGLLRPFRAPRLNFNMRNAAFQQ